MSDEKETQETAPANARNGVFIGGYVNPQVKEYLKKRGKAENRNVTNMFCHILYETMKNDNNDYDK